MSRTLSVVTVALLLSSSLAGAQSSVRISVDPHSEHGESMEDESLAARVREAASIYRDINQAIATSYAQVGGCVSGPEVGAMGVHFVNGALIYEIKNGVARLVGAEPLSLAGAL